MTTYITTNENTDMTLEPGKKYFADFDVGQIPFETRRKISMITTAHSYARYMADRGHYITEVTASAPDWQTLRITFRTSNNVIPLLVVIAAAVAVIIVALGIGLGVYALFKGIGEVPVIPANLLKNIVENPLPVIAIIMAAGIFLLGRKL